jgi:protein SCO1/2
LDRSSFEELPKIETIYFMTDHPSDLVQDLAQERTRERTQQVTRSFPDRRRSSPPTAVISGLRGLGGLLLGLGLAACAPVSAPPVQPPSPDVAGVDQPRRVSLFNHRWSWTDEQGQPAPFSRWRGQPLVVTAIFTQCRATCPRTVAKLRQVYDRFRNEGHSAQFLLVTLDPANDTREILQRFKASSGLPDSWHLLSGSIDDTRDLRDTLGIHVIDDGPHLLHDGRIVVFDAQGLPTRSFGGYALNDEAAL